MLAQNEMKWLFYLPNNLKLLLF